MSGKAVGKTMVEWSAEKRARVDGIELAYSVLGWLPGPAMLLINGLGGQLVSWDDGFCRLLAERGFAVIRFDNRDAGHSTKLDASSPARRGQRPSRHQKSLYTLADMADDTAGLLGHLGLSAAHVVGLSMGGMIAQTLAVNHPERVTSLASIMSSTGNPSVGRPHPLGLEPQWRAGRPSREEYVERMVAFARRVSTERFPPDVPRLRRQLAAAYDRGYHPPGVVRQMIAVAASGDRTKTLGHVSAPTLVVHGSEDPVVDVSGGRATAAAIPNSKLMIIEGMGHYMSRRAWPQIVEAIAENCRRAGPAD
jgi:pimeloyl-ACP methyl ester carboxylesterase